MKLAGVPDSAPSTGKSPPSRCHAHPRWRLSFSIQRLARKHVESGREFQSQELRCRIQRFDRLRPHQAAAHLWTALHADIRALRRAELALRPRPSEEHRPKLLARRTSIALPRLAE